LRARGYDYDLRPRGSTSASRAPRARASVEVDVAGQRFIASITVEALHDLGLSEGDAVTAVIKASDAILAKE
jgi:molybdopterin-binding protein